jgi:hypothetical protein
MIYPSQIAVMRPFIGPLSRHNHDTPKPVLVVARYEFKTKRQPRRSEGNNQIDERAYNDISSVLIIPLDSQVLCTLFVSFVLFVVNSFFLFGL